MGAEGLSTVQVRKCDSRTSDSSGQGGLAIQASFTARQGVRILQTAIPAVSEQGNELLNVTKRMIGKSLKFLFSTFGKLIQACNGKFKVLKSVCGSVS